MKNFTWKKKLFLSYIFVGVIPIMVLGAFFFYGSRMSAGREKEKNNASMLASMMQKMDYMIEKMNSAAYHLSGLEMIDWLDEVRDRKMDLDEGMVSSQLSTYSDIIGDVEGQIETFLYLRGDKYIYTQDGRVRYQDFQQDMSQYGDLNQATFFGNINSIKNERAVRIGGGTPEKDLNAQVSFLYPVPYMNNIPVATIGFFVDYNNFSKLVKNYYPLNSYIYIFDARFQNIFIARPEIKEDMERQSETETAIDAFVQTYRSKGAKLDRVRLDDRNYIVMREVSANSGFSVITITENEDFYQYESMFADWFIALFGILLAGGVLLSLILSKNNYRPIQNLIDKISDDDREDIQESRDEFTLIHNRWNDIQNRNEELNALLNRQRPMVVATCLRQILKGKFRKRDEMEAMLKSAAINLSYRYNFVILLPIPMEEGFDQEKNLRILSLLFNNLYPFLHMYGLDMLKDDGIAIIVNCRDKKIEEDEKDIRLAVAQKLDQRLQQEYGMELKFYVSRFCEDPMDISRSFVEASVLADDYKISGDRNILLFEELDTEEEKLSWPVLEQAVYIQCLKQANEEEALKALDNMVKEINLLNSLLIMQCLCFDIINAAFKTVDQMKGFELKNVDLKKICNFSGIAEFHDRATTLTVEICRQFAEFKDNRNNAMKTGILDYVNAHFNESSMGLETVANKFGLSANYLSRFFKQETGCSFIQYVTMIRMDRVKELLINSDKQVKDIVAEVGYIDAANFVRKFKNYEGITPGQYRERMRKK